MVQKLSICFITERMQKSRAVRTYRGVREGERLIDRIEDEFGLSIRNRLIQLAQPQIQARLQNLKLKLRGRDLQRLQFAIDNRLDVDLYDGPFDSLLTEHPFDSLDAYLSKIAEYIADEYEEWLHR